MWRPLRIGLLLAVLGGVALSLWTEQARLARWQDPVWVALYPINADGVPAVADYIDRLEERDFAPIERYLREQAAGHPVPTDQPVEVKLAPAVAASPPQPPASGATLATMLWSLRLRFWAWRHDTFDGPAEIRLFVRYHAPRDGRRLAHSVGLEKARIGVVNAFGSPNLRGRNRVVMAHELLHTLGARDKYDPATGEPTYPSGFAAPGREPRYPQRRAELMGGRIPLGPDESRMPKSLAETVIGPASAAEIGWRPPP